MADVVQSFADAVLAENPVHRRFMESALSNLKPEERKHLTEYLNYGIRKGLSIPYLAESYQTVVTDTLREQIYFQKHGKYRHSSFAEVGDAVYFNNEYMSHYMYGLALTSFLWPNHLAMHRFFDETLPRNKTGKYLEIGPGHGYFMMKAASSSSFTEFLGVDISETSVAQTRAILDHFAPTIGGRVKLECMDFLITDLPPASFDAIVMGEVLEHVEEPATFLKRIAQLAKKDAWIFITTCTNAPAIDHIFLFRSPAEVEKMFADCGLRVVKPLICPYEGKTLQESLDQKLAINVAYVLEKA